MVNNLSTLKEVCDKFQISPNINPLTNRKIKKGGQSYKKLVKNCNFLMTSPTQANKTELDLLNRWFVIRKQSNETIRTFASEHFPGKSLSWVKKHMNRNLNNFHVSSFNIKHIRDSILRKNRERKSKQKISVAGIKVEKTKHIGGFEVPQIINNKWVLSEKLGRGSYGVIYKCFDIENKKEYAIKIEKYYEDMVFEPDIYSQIVETQMKTKTMYKKKLYTPKIYEASFLVDPKTGKIWIYFVMERLFPIPEFNINKIPDVLNSFEILNKLKISHADIKFDNMMQRENGDVVLIDYGMSKEINTKKLYFSPYGIKGTLLYLSINSHNNIISWKNDLESLCFAILDALNVVPWFVMDYDTPEDMVVKSKQNTIDQILQGDEETIKWFKLHKHPKLYLFLVESFSIGSLQKPNYKKLSKVFLT